MKPPQSPICFALFLQLSCLLGFVCCLDWVSVLIKSHLSSLRGEPVSPGPPRQPWTVVHLDIAVASPSLGFPNLRGLKARG
jgi:hypothetical protein